MKRFFNLSVFSLLLMFFMSAAVVGNDGDGDEVLKYVITEGTTANTFKVVGGDLDIDNEESIQKLIDAIRSDIMRPNLPGSGMISMDCSIQFGEDETEEFLDIGNEWITFTSETGGWGHITLSGKITSSNASAMGIIHLKANVSVDSYADIKNSSAGSSTRAIFIESSFEPFVKLTIKAGTVSADDGTTIYNQLGMIEINGGTVTNSSQERRTIDNASARQLTVSGGTVSGGIYAIYSDGGSDIIISGENTEIISNSVGAAIYSSGNGSVKIFDGAKVSNTSSGNALYITGGTDGLIEISGGAEITANTGAAIRNVSPRSIEIEDAVVSTNSTAASGYAIENSGNANVTITGGEVKALQNGGTAIYNSSTGDITISGTKVSAENGFAVYNNSNGKITISGGAEISSKNTQVINGGTIRNNGSGSIIIEDAEVTNNNSGGALAVLNFGVGSVTVNDGLLSIASDGYVIRNNSGGTVTINGGDISGRGGALYNGTNGTLVISGGDIQSVGGKAVDNNSAKDMKISGGKIGVTGTTGVAIYHDSNGKITISGDAQITSENTQSDEGTVINISGGTIEIIDAEVLNTAGANRSAIYNEDGSIILGGSPKIEGLIIGIDGGKLSVIVSEDGDDGDGDGDKNEFVPPAQGVKYSLSFFTPVSQLAAGMTAVAGGAEFAEYFELRSSTNAAVTNFLLVPGENNNLVTAAARTVTFSRNDGSSGSAAVISTLTVISGGKFNISQAPLTDEITRVGFVHDGKWYTGTGSSSPEFEFDEDGNSVTAVTANTTLSLRWTALRTVTFMFEDDAGTDPFVLSVPNGSKVNSADVPPTDGITKEDYEHDDKWYTRTGSSSNYIYTEFKFGEEGASVTSNIILYVQWKSVGVLVSDRRIPQYLTPNTDTPALSVTASELSVGPNPVLRQTGAVNFFKQGGAIERTALSIYDQSGNLVKKINISDSAFGSKAQRIVGLWDLTDLKGRPVSQGTYLVRGTVTARDGSKERVSLIIGVR